MEFPPKYFRFYEFKDARGWGEALTQPFRVYGCMDPARGCDDTSNQTSQTLWLQEHWLKSGYFKQTWGDMEGGRVGSWWAHALQEVWLERHAGNCHPGDHRHLFLAGDEKTECQEKKQIIIVSMKEASNGKRYQLSIRKLLKQRQKKDSLPLSSNILLCWGKPRKVSQFHLA